MNRLFDRNCWLAALSCTFLGVVVCPSPAQAAFLLAEPDQYAPKTAIPDNIGVMLRNADYPPGHAEFNRSWRRIYAVAPDSYVRCGPSTGDLVLGNDYEPYFNGTDYGLRAWFTEPTSYVGFDLCWAKASGWSEGARVQVYGNDMDGNEIALLNRVYKPSGSYTTFSLFHPGITRVRITCWDDTAYFRQHAFAVDDFKFVDSSGTAFAVADGETMEAPAGMTLGVNDSLSGNGGILGHLTNRGTVRPGASPGKLTISGDYTQEAEGNCVIELAGVDAGQFDVLSVIGIASLGGTLTIELNGYTPQPGEQFTILSYGSCPSGFDAVVSPDGTFFDLDYGATALTLTVLPEPAALGMLSLAGLLLARRRR